MDIWFCAHNSPHLPEGKHTVLVKTPSLITFFIYIVYCMPAYSEKTCNFVFFFTLCSSHSVCECIPWAAVLSILHLLHLLNQDLKPIYYDTFLTSVIMSRILSLSSFYIKVVCFEADFISILCSYLILFVIFIFIFFGRLTVRFFFFYLPFDGENFSCQMVIVRCDINKRWQIDWFFILIQKSSI